MRISYGSPIASRALIKGLIALVAVVITNVTARSFWASREGWLSNKEGVPAFEDDDVGHGAFRIARGALTISWSAGR
jgi:hypothetical protein